MTYPIDTIYIYNGASRMEVPLTDSAERSHSLQQHNYVKLAWKSAQNIPIVANAYIVWDGQRFFCTDDYFPAHKDGIYEYDIEFHSIEDTFNRPIFFRYVEVFDQATQSKTTWKEAEWSLNGNLKTIGDIITNSLNKCGYDAEFRLPKGNTYNDTTLKPYSFSGVSIADALATIAETNETEWWLETLSETNASGQPIYYLHFDKCEHGDSVTLTDEYKEENGVWQSGGLKSVSQSGNVNVIPERLYVYGSDRNIIKKTVEEQTEGGKMNVSYDKRLRLPVIFPQVSGLDGTANWKTYKNEALGLECTLNDDSSISINGINNKYEQIKMFDEVYPKMTMAVKNVSILNPQSDTPIYYLTSDSIKSLTTEEPADTSINPGKLGLLIDGCTLMCTFTSGLLNGMEFECAWRESTAEIGLVPKDENDVQIPNSVFKPNEGDTFILWNLAMPQSSVTQAQNELAVKALKYIEEVVTSITETDCVTEAETFREKGYADSGLIKIGQRIMVTSDVFCNGALSSRIIKYSYKLTKPYDINFTLASSRQTGRLATLENMIADTTHEVHAFGQTQRAISRRQWHDTEEMMEMLDSIQKQLVVVGDENNAFAASCNFNYDNTTKVLSISRGYLQHQSFTTNSWKGAWLIQDSITGGDFSFSLTNADVNQAFYVYFKCSKKEGSGVVEYGATLPAETDDYYIFTFGILSSEFEGERVFNQTSGLTTISGGTITTDVIQDPARRLIIDYSNATIIARNGATIKGAIQFEKGNGENDLGTALDDLLNGVQNAQSEAESVRTEYKQAVSALEGELNSGLASVQGSVSNLQTQIDGEVNSWFMEGKPTLGNEPAKNWTTETEKKRHKGDTYTDITEYVDDTTTPTAGQSWRWCNCSYTTDDGMDIYGWHWHKIADSDAVKALAEAGKAQSTADGKSTTFVVQPSNYSKGDLWILQSDTAHTAGKKGDILTANEASVAYVASNWSKEVKYTDDTAVENLQIGGRNLLRNKYSYWFPADGVVMTITDGVIRGTNSSNNYPRLYNNSVRSIDFIVDQEYTLSLDVKANAEGTRSVRVADANGSNVVLDFPVINVTTEWQRVSVTAKAKIKISTNGLLQIWVARNVSNGVVDTENWVEIKNVQLEQGNKATSYKPNDADTIDARINLIKGGMMLNMKASSTQPNILTAFNQENGTRVGLGLKPNTEYVFSVERTLLNAGTATEFTISIWNSTITSERLKTTIPISSSGAVHKIITTPSTVTSSDILLVYCGINNQCNGNNITFFGLKLAEGNKYVGYEASQEEKEAIMTLQDAMKGSTDIIGGLVLTNLIELKNQDGKVTAGLNGLDTVKYKDTSKSDNPNGANLMLWGGGTIDEALGAISGTQTLPVILTREGKGSNIGCLVVEDENGKVRVKTKNGGSVLIDAEGGISVYDGQGDNEVEKIRILDENIDASYVTFDRILALNGGSVSNIAMTSAAGQVIASYSFKVNSDKNDLLLQFNSLNIQVSISGEWKSKSSSTTASSVRFSHSIVFEIYDVDRKNIYKQLVYNIAQNASLNVSGGTTSNPTVTGSCSIIASGSQDYEARDLPVGNYQFRIVYTNPLILPAGALIVNGQYGVQGTISLSVNNTIYAEYTERPPITILGNNGLIVRSNYTTFAYIEVGEKQLDMRLRGLPTSKPSVSNRLYNDSGTLKIS